MSRPDDLRGGRTLNLRDDAIDWAEDAVLGKPANRVALEAYDGGASRSEAARQAGISSTTAARLLARRRNFRRAGIVRD